jgi:hypothetical protein
MNPKLPKLPLRIKCKESRMINSVSFGAVIASRITRNLNNEYLVIWEGFTSEWVNKNELEKIAHPIYRNKLVKWDKPEVKAKIESLAR